MRRGGAQITSKTPRFAQCKKGMHPFDNRGHGILAHERAKGPKKLVTIPNITHYGIYGEARQQSVKLAIEWFDAHLKNDPPAETAKE
jgi:hypothetical protein